MRRNTNHDGFTLIELMLVVQVIAILVALAMPSLIRARVSANEASAASSMRLISMSQASFKASRFVDAADNGEGDYATLEQLHNPDDQGELLAFIDSHLAAGRKAGYEFEVEVILGGPDTAPAYEAFATPITPFRSGVRRFYVDEESVIRFTADGTPPGSNSTPLN